MSRRETYETRAEELLLPIAEENGVEIYDVEYVKEGSDWYLRAYIDKPGGVDINDCERVSRTLSDRLDEEDFIEDAYILEVSSPGLGRTLKKRGVQAAGALEKGMFVLRAGPEPGKMNLTVCCPAAAGTHSMRRRSKAANPSGIFRRLSSF